MSKQSIDYNMADFIRQKAGETPDKRAIVVPVSRTKCGRCTYAQMTFRQLEDETNRYAHGLVGIGIKRGTKVVLMITPGIEFFIAFFALCKVGAVMVMIDPGIGLPSLKKCLGEAEPEAFIGLTKAHAARVIMGWAKNSIKILVTLGMKLFWGGHSFHSLRSQNSSPYPIERMPENEMAALMFTSGSTGISKGAVYTHGVLCNQVKFIQEIYGFKAEDVDLATFPLFALFDVCLGMTAIIPDMDSTKPAQADPKKLIEAIEDNGATSMFGSPALIDTLSRYGEKYNIKMPSIRLVLSCGAPARNDILQRLQLMLPESSEIFTPYGATEALPVSSIGSHQILVETAPITDTGGGTCVGKAIPQVQVRIIKIDDNPIKEWSEDLVLPVNTIGEITAKGPIVTREYYRRPESTLLSKIAEGDEVWHRMGDLGRIDEQGNIWFCGRKNHRVVDANRTYFTIPCERIFNQHPKVFRTALANAGTKENQIPVICVELEKDISDINTEQLSNELIELGSKFEHTKDIKHFIIHPGFPVDIRHNAKITREALSKWAAEKLRNRL